ncbi:MAG TPA: fumarylacetoacetate hydrolase family protein [Candidatus Acidoferrum sp.]|nr:fumarylacetoacetate hydrolase family protein [Candidatus Acidoferrum sp.]
MTAAWDDPRISRGMAAQLAHRRELLNAGQKPLGWKLAFGGPAAMDRLRTNAPLVGFLMRNGVVASGSTLSLSHWIKPAAEPEIAVHLGKDLPAGSDRRTVMDAIAGLGPAIEVADVNHPSDDVEGTLACNIYQRHVVLGRNDVNRAGGVLGGLTCRVLRNGTEIANVTGGDALQALTGKLIDIVRHVGDLLAVFGERLQAGQIIIAGSIIPPIWLEAGENIVFDLTPGDTISIRFDSESPA